MWRGMVNSGAKDFSHTRVRPNSFIYSILRGFFFPLRSLLHSFLFTNAHVKKALPAQIPTGLRVVVLQLAKRFPRHWICSLGTAILVMKERGLDRRAMEDKTKKHIPFNVSL